MRTKEKALGKKAGAADSKSSAAQREIISALERPDSYPGDVSEVTRIETHAAMLFLAGDRAYKLKRSVKLPYLDFSTIEKRRAVLLRELEINSKISPELYLSVLPLSRDADTGAIAIAGSGEAVDWLLVMRRFDEQAMLDRVAARGELGRKIITDLAHAIEHFHRHAIIKKTGQWVKSLFRVADDLETALCGGDASSVAPGLKPYLERLQNELAAQAPLLAEREQAGFVRRCHGDLHLKNIVLWEGMPKLFDALEFDEELATIDVLYDLAFLLMDLWHRGLNAEANEVLNHYFQRAAIIELQGLGLLPLFLSLRAAVRAMTGLHGLSYKLGRERERASKEIRGYARLAESLLNKRPPQLIAIGGLSGTGKTSAARWIAPFIGNAPGALHLRTDIERKVMHGVAPTYRLPPSAYSSETSGEVYRRLYKKAEIVLGSGHSVVADAVFPDSPSRSLLSDAAQRAGTSFHGFWLEAPGEKICGRISARIGDASDANIEVLARQSQTAKPPEDWAKIDASGEATDTAGRVMSALGITPGDQGCV